MSIRSFQLALAAAVLAACGDDHAPTAPSLARAGGLQFSAAPTAVDFTFPPGGSEVITITAQYLTTVTSSSSNTGCATVSPSSVPTKKPKSTSSYMATFTVTAAGVGTCTITLSDKNGKSTTVQVTVAAPLPDRIVYSSLANGSSDVYIMDLDGQNKAPLTATTDQSEYGSLSVDGRKILLFWIKQIDGVWYAGYNVMGVDGTGQTPVGVSGEIFYAAFSPNRQQLVYSRYLENRYRLFKADLSGANEVQLTFAGTDPTSDQYPSWAGGLPGRIVFVREGQRSIWIMNADGTGQTLVVDNGDNWLHGPPTAALSPDGTRIAFSCQPTTHVYDICIVNVDGTGKAQLTNATGADRYPRWTRDGRIIFTSERDGNSEVYIMNADGTGQENLTNTAGVDESTVMP
jgi:TolB protein